MADKQIHELDPAAAVGSSDQMVVSTFGSNLTRRASLQDFPTKGNFAGTVDRTIAAKVSERVSVMDFGAIADGIADDSGAFNAAMTSGASDIYIPAGTYRIANTVTVGGNMRVTGAGYGSAILVGETSGPIIRVVEGEYVNSSITDIGIEMGTTASAGISVVGHRVILDRIWFRQGAPTAWAIEMIDANECVLSHIMAGISGPDQFTANGIHWYNSDPLTNFVNYGDSWIIQPVIRLASSNTTAMLFDGGQNGNLCNNVNIERAQINAPLSGAVPFSGTIGMHFKNTARMRVIGCGFEAIETAVLEEAHTNQAGANVGNTYVGCYAINALVPYADSNGTVPRSVQQRTFIGCDSFPEAVGLADGDSLLPAGMFLSSFNTGTPGICFRSFKPDTVLITPDGTSNEEYPAKGLAIESTSSNATRISRPQGQNSNVVSRFEIGNGTSHPNGGLRDVTIKDPLRLEPRNSQLVAPTAGHIVFVTDNSANVVTGAVYDGPGLYAFLPRASGGNDWIKVASNNL